jgi:hypothetical protein
MRRTVKCLSEAKEVRGEPGGVPCFLLIFVSLHRMINFEYGEMGQGLWQAKEGIREL